MMSGERATAVVTRRVRFLGLVVASIAIGLGADLPQQPGYYATLGPARAAIIVEPDAVASGCFDGNRAALLQRIIQRLVEAGQHVYPDAGHPRWWSVGETARRLREAGITRADGDWCHPSRPARGEKPTTAVRRPGLAALLWIKPPGESDGYCGGETNHDFSPARAENLIRNAPPR